MLMQKLVNPLIKTDEGGNVIPEKPIEKQYVIFVEYNDENTARTYEICLGREEVIEYLSANIEDIDIVKTHVASETMTMINAITAYSFLRMMIGLKLSVDVNPDDYLDDGVDGDEIFVKDNEVK